MANKLGPEGLSETLRKSIYHFVLEDEVLIFSKPSLSDNQPTTTFLDASYSQYFIKREGMSAPAIAGVSAAVRATALAILASLVKFDLGNKATVQWFRDTFPSSFRKAVDHVVIGEDATTHFSVPSVRIGWAASKTVTILELPNTETHRLKEEMFDSIAEATAWVQDKLGSGVDWEDLEPCFWYCNRSFDVFCAVYVNKSTDAVVKLTKSSVGAEGRVAVESVEFASPGLPGERRVDKRQEYFEAKRNGFGSVPEVAMAKLRLWAKPEGHVLG